MTDPAQARLLSDPETVRYLEPFLARERTASEAARELGVRLDTLLYRIRVFLRAGLLTIARTEPRAGRPIKHYRSDADAYFVPFEATPYADLEERLRAQLVPQAKRTATLLARGLHAYGPYGRRLYRNGAGEVWHDMSDAPRRSLEADDPRLPPQEAFSDQLRLGSDQARSLLAELRLLWARYQRAQDPAAPPYLFAFTLARDVEADG